VNRQRIFERTAVLIAILLMLVPGLIAADDSQPPRLVLQITVDALRGDLPGRYAHLFGDDGFRYLMDEGVHYTNARYQHANTETIVGHVSLATGTVPAAHGMVGNVWFDREQGRLVYTGRQDQKLAALALVRSGIAEVGNVMKPVVVNDAEDVRRRLDHHGLVAQFKPHRHLDAHRVRRQPQCLRIHQVFEHQDGRVSVARS